MKNDLNNMKWKFVASTKEAVDLYIMNHVKAGDLVVTQDIGLASTLLPKDAFVFFSVGNILFEEKNDSNGFRYEVSICESPQEWNLWKRPKTIYA